jgi:hypothetical protein
VKQSTIDVQLFEGGDSFQLYATRMRVRCVSRRANPFVWHTH